MNEQDRLTELIKEERVKDEKVNRIQVQKRVMIS